jgi:hypothetical protein
MAMSCRCLLLFSFVTTKKVTTAIAVAFFFGSVTMKKAMTTSYHCLLLWFYCNKEGDGSLLLPPFSF